MTTIPTPAGYHHYTPIGIRYADMDTLGHVNNAKYVTYLEQARIQYVTELGLWEGGIVHEGLIVAKVTVEYKLPMTIHDITAHVWTRCARVGTKSLEIEHVILRTDAAVVAASATVVVAYDYLSNRSIPVPDAWRTKLTTYEAG